MTLQPGTEPQLAGGWLAYCARLTMSNAKNILSA